MFSNTDYQQIIRRSFLTAALLAALICIGVAINAASAGRAASGFELANDLPRWRQVARGSDGDFEVISEKFANINVDQGYQDDNFV